MVGSKCCQICKNAKSNRNVAKFDKFEEVPGSKVSGSKIVELKKKLVVNLASLATFVFQCFL